VVAVEWPRFVNITAAVIVVRWTSSRCEHCWRARGSATWQRVLAVLDTRDLGRSDECVALDNRTRLK
jgi:hypothetical protein